MRKPASRHGRSGLSTSVVVDLIPCGKYASPATCHSVGMSCSPHRPCDPGTEQQEPSLTDVLPLYGYQVQVFQGHAGFNYEVYRLAERLAVYQPVSTFR